MGVHPKSIYKSKVIKSESLKVFYKKPDEKEVLSQIKQIIEVRPSYGYKRVTAMLNKQRGLEGLKAINKKKIHRIMSKNNLILPKNKIHRNHQSTGKVMSLFSNIRWCSDCFEIKCFNGEKVFVSFVLDTCDREVISYLSKSEPILSQDIQEIILNAVESRFPNGKPVRTIEFLSDRGAIYRAHNVVQFTKELNLKSCFTASYSPESNGMSEALVKTIKRDYVYVSDCESAQVVMELLPHWINDYNENAPHSALKMMSPRNFIRSRSVKASGLKQDAIPNWTTPTMGVTLHF